MLLLMVAAPVKPPRLLVVALVAELLAPEPKNVCSMLIIMDIICIMNGRTISRTPAMEEVSAPSDVLVVDEVGTAVAVDVVDVVAEVVEDGRTEASRDDREVEEALLLEAVDVAGEAVVVAVDESVLTDGAPMLWFT